MSRIKREVDYKKVVQQLKRESDCFYAPGLWDRLDELIKKYTKPERGGRKVEKIQG